MCDRDKGLDRKNVSEHARGSSNPMQCSRVDNKYGKDSMKHRLEEIRGHTAAGQHANSLMTTTFEEHRALLFSVAYRMLGSRADAEDMLQETFLRWRQVDVEAVESSRAFLVTIITRLCINHMQSARHRREEYFGQWLPEPLVTAATSDPSSTPGLDGSLSIAFLLLMERLSPTERAVFLLREVFDYEYAEVASALELSEANCRQILRRAKQHIADGQPRFDVSEEQRQRVLQQFLRASIDGDIQGLMALLSNDVTLYADGGGKVTAVPNPIYGAGNVVRFLIRARQKFLPPGTARRPANINGQPGILAYDGEQLFGALSLDVLDGKIRSIYIFRNPDKLSHLQACGVEATEAPAQG